MQSIGDYEFDVYDLLDSIRGQTLAIRRLKCMLLEVYRCICECPWSPWFIQYKYHTLSTQNVKAGAAIAQNNEVWAEPFFYVGSHLWISVLNDHGAHIDFKAFLITWKGPDIFRYAISFGLGWLPVLWVVCFLVTLLSCIWYLYWYFYCNFVYVFFSLIMIYLIIALYVANVICFPYDLK